MGNAALFLSHYVKVEHFTPDSPGANKEGYTVDMSLQAVPCNIQPAAPEIVALNNGAYGKAYLMFTTNSGILHTDRLTTVSGVDSRQYIVKGRNFFDYDDGEHLEIYLEEVQE